MTEKKKGLFGNLFKPKDCGCGVSIVEEKNPTDDKSSAKDKNNHKEKTR